MSYENEFPFPKHLKVTAYFDGVEVEAIYQLNKVKEPIRNIYLSCFGKSLDKYLKCEDCEKRKECVEIYLKDTD